MSAPMIATTSAPVAAMITAAMTTMMTVTSIIARALAATRNTLLTATTANTLTNSQAVRNTSLTSVSCSVTWIGERLLFRAREGSVQEYRTNDEFTTRHAQQRHEERQHFWAHHARGRRFYGFFKYLFRDRWQRSIARSLNAIPSSGS